MGLVIRKKKKSRYISKKSLKVNGTEHIKHKKHNVHRQSSVHGKFIKNSLKNGVVVSVMKGGGGRSKRRAARVAAATGATGNLDANGAPPKVVASEIKIGTNATKKGTNATKLGTNATKIGASEIPKIGTNGPKVSIGNAVKAKINAISDQTKIEQSLASAVKMIHLPEMYTDKHTLTLSPEHLEKVFGDMSKTDDFKKLINSTFKGYHSATKGVANTEAKIRNYQDTHAKTVAQRSANIEKLTGTAQTDAKPKTRGIFSKIRHALGFSGIAQKASRKITLNHLQKKQAQNEFNNKHASNTQMLQTKLLNAQTLLSGTTKSLTNLAGKRFADNLAAAKLATETATAGVDAAVRSTGANVPKILLDVIKPTGIPTQKSVDFLKTLNANITV